MSYEARVYLNWKMYGHLPVPSMYDLDVGLYFTLLEIDTDMQDLIVPVTDETGM